MAETTPTGSTLVDQWFNRFKEAEDVKATWEKDYRIADGYQFWRGNQLADPFDAQQDRKAQINKLHPMVRSQIPSLYFYRPFGRVVAAPEKADTPLETVSEKAQLLQDTGNYFVRNPETYFRESTFLALKEAFWSFGCVEVGYSADFAENPSEEKPAIKEDEKTKTDSPATEDDSDETENPDYVPSDEDLKALKDSLKSECFYVKFISAKQVLISPSDKAVLNQNDWIGYYEDFPVEDVKRSKAYKNVRNLKPSASPGKDQKGEPTTQNVRLYKIWDLRTKTRWVFAEGHKKPLLKKTYKRLPLKFYRPDLDPYHFYPLPPISNALSRQEEYNHGREWMRKVRKGTVPRFTVDEDGFAPGEVEKFETDDVNIYIKRRANMTGDVISPVQQPNISQLVLQDLQLTEKEFNEQTGTPAESRQAQTGGSKTATQAVLQSNQSKIEDSFDRSQVSEWLASIIEELILLAIEHMNISQWIALNVDPDSPFAPFEQLKVAKTYKEITGNALEQASAGLKWHVDVDVDSLSPQAEQEQEQKFLRMLNFLGNPAQAMLLAKSPQLLQRLLSLMGLKSSRDQEAIKESLQAVIQMQMEQARAGIGQPGVAPIAGQPPINPVQQAPAPPTALPAPGVGNVGQ